MTQYAPMYVEAAKLTLRLGIAGILLSLVAGLVCALIQYYKVPVLKRIVAVYIELSRNTPSVSTALFIIFRASEDGDCLDIRDVCSGRTDIFGRQLYGGGIPKRTGIGG